MVHEVIPATTTAPWSSTNSPRSAECAITGLLGRPADPLDAEGRKSTAPLSAKDSAAGSLAGKDSSSASSSLVCGVGWFSST